MRFPIAAGLLAQALPAESGQNDIFGDALGKKKRMLALLREQNTNGHVRFPYQKSLKKGSRHSFTSNSPRNLSNDRRVINSHLSKAVVECDPNLINEADIGILSCGVGQYCFKSPESQLGGVCVDSTVSDQRSLESDDVYYSIGEDIALYAKHFCNESSPYYQYYACDCTDFDHATFNGSVQCVIEHIDCDSVNFTDGHFDYGNYSYSYLSTRRLNETLFGSLFTNSSNIESSYPNASYTNGICGMSTLEITANGEHNFTAEYCIQYNKPYDAYWCYNFGTAGQSAISLFCENQDYNCDCSGFNSETETGSIDCTLYDTYCFDCAETTCATISMQMEFYGPSSYNYFVCYDFLKPYEQHICYQQGYPGEECGISFNGEMCKECHQVSDQCADFKCTNSETVFEGNTCTVDYEFPILSGIDSADRCSNGATATPTATPMTPAPVTDAPATSPTSAGVPSITSALKLTPLVGLSIALLAYFSS